MRKRNLIFNLIFITSLAFIACSEDTISVSGEGTLTGTVVADNTNEPLGNVKISTNPASSTTFTDATGAFVISPIEIDDYSVQAELEGYVVSFEAVTINDGETSNVVFELITSQANNKAPDVPQLLSPQDGEENLSTEIDFIWSSGSNDNDILTYDLELRNGSSTEIETYEIVGDTTLTVSNLSLGTNYFWQITSSDEVNPPVRSAVSQFKTVAVPDNRFLYVKTVNGNSVIFSGNDNDSNNEEESDEINFNQLQLTSDSFNSFRPRRNPQVNKIAFLRTANGSTHLFTMDLDGTDVKQVTSNIPVNGFRINQVDFTWARNGSRLYYPNFDKLYSINPDGGGAELIYQTPDGNFISEVDAAQFDNDLIVVKTNNADGYNARIYTVRLSTGIEESVVLENVNGALGGLDFNANATQVLYARDLSGSENDQYRQFQSRVFIYDFSTGTSELVDTQVEAGQNDVDPRWSPSEGGIILTRVGSNINASPSIFTISFGDSNNQDDLLFTNASQPDWE